LLEKSPAGGECVTYRLSIGWVIEQPPAATRARIFKLLRSPRIDYKEPTPPGCVAWRAGTTTRSNSVPGPHIDCLKSLTLYFLAVAIGGVQERLPEHLGRVLGFSTCSISHGLKGTVQRDGSGRN
jgi:hypothetical protein